MYLKLKDNFNLNNSLLWYLFQQKLLRQMKVKILKILNISIKKILCWGVIYNQLKESIKVKMMHWKINKNNNQN